MLTIGMLRNYLNKHLSDISDDAPVIIGRETVADANLLAGRLSSDVSYFGERRFSIPPDETKRTTLALVFLRNTELSDGTLTLTDI